MSQLINELNQYFAKNDNLISAEQGLNEYAIEDWGIYAFAYLDDEGNLTHNTTLAETSFSAELTYLDSDDEESWDKLTFDIVDPNWLKVLEELAEKIIEYRSDWH